MLLFLYIIKMKKKKNVSWLPNKIKTEVGNVAHLP